MFKKNNRKLSSLKILIITSYHKLSLGFIVATFGQWLDREWMDESYNFVQMSFILRLNVCSSDIASVVNCWIREQFHVLIVASDGANKLPF